MLSAGASDLNNRGIRPSLLLQLNRFTINSINHNHYDNDRLAYKDDDNNVIVPYWLRSAGVGHEWDSQFRIVAHVWTSGFRSAALANPSHIGFRPAL